MQIIHRKDKPKIDEKHTKRAEISALEKLQKSVDDNEQKNKELENDMGKQLI